MKVWNQTIKKVVALITEREEENANNESMAEAFDMPESAAHHEEAGKAYRACLDACRALLRPEQPHKEQPND